MHLPPLPGSPRGASARELPALLARVRSDAAAYKAGGVDALIMENFGDVPFRPVAVAPHVVAAMTLAVATASAETGLPVGVNVLRNDVVAAVSIAAATGARFVRANVYVGAALTDQGVIEGCAEEVQSLIKRLDAAVDVWADIDVKHAVPLAPRPLPDLAEDAVDRGLASAVIVTGRATGQPAALEDLDGVRAAVPATPLYVGSGVGPDVIDDMLDHADGVIVGTAAKRDGLVTNPVDEGRVRAIVEAARRETGLRSGAGGERPR